MDFIQKHKLLFILTVLFIVSGLMILPIYLSGIPNGNDLPQHYQFALTFKQGLQNGILYPSWAATPNFGFGDIGIRFYPPFSYYVLVFFEAILGNWFYASVAAFWFWFFLSGIGIYFWSREWFGENASLLAAVVYIFAPYHVNQIYNAFTYAEFASASILPFCFLFVTRICRREGMINTVGLAFCYGLLLLTHLPMAVIGSLALGVYSLALLEKTNYFKKLLNLTVSVFFGLLASSFYWFRMVSELSFVNHATEEFTSGAYDFHKNFVGAFLYLPFAEYDDRTLWFCDLMLFITLALFIPSAILYYRNRQEKQPKLFSVVALLAFAIFISTPLSLPIWENLEPLQKVQFPWRWLAVISMSGVIFVAAGYETFISYFQSEKRPVAILTIGLIFAGFVFTVTQVIKPASFIPQDQFNESIAKLESKDSYPCWWAIWSKSEAFKEKTKVLAKDRQIEIQDWNLQEKRFQISAGEAQNLRLALFYYPYWKATVNEKMIELKPAADGTILLPIENEKTDVRVWFEEPAKIKNITLLSMFSWFILFLSALIFGFRERNKKRNLSSQSALKSL
ncbi:MAG: 6-pyruvoyl-tetrahydropterin synthase-related protein [Acidobacteriota bacterium]